MGRRGPKPQPTALKIERGNPGKRRLNDAEPDLAPGERAVPAGMTGVAKAEWLRLIDELTDKGVLTVGDFRCFEEYCHIVGDIADVRKLIRKVGTEEAIANRYVHYLDKLRSQKTRHEAHLGITPSSRSAVKAVPVSSPKQKQGESPRDRLLRKVNGAG